MRTSRRVGWFSLMGGILSPDKSWYKTGHEERQCQHRDEPAARKVRDIYADPPRGGWNRRNFLQTLTALGAMPLLTEAPAFAQAQRGAGRMKVTDIKIQRLRVEKDWGTYRGLRRGTARRTHRRRCHHRDLHRSRSRRPRPRHRRGVGKHGQAISGRQGPVRCQPAHGDPLRGGREGGLGRPAAGGHRNRPLGSDRQSGESTALQAMGRHARSHRAVLEHVSARPRQGAGGNRAAAEEPRLEGDQAEVALRDDEGGRGADRSGARRLRPDFIITTDANKAGFSIGLQGTRGVPWTFQRAVETAREFERLGVFFLEEPLPKYDFERLAELNRLTSMNLAGGEAQNPGVQEFRWLLEKGCFDIIQPEINAQGVAVLQKVAVIAESMEKMICPHLGDGRLEHRLRHAPGRDLAQRAAPRMRQRGS